MDWRREWKWLVLGVGAFAAMAHAFGLEYTLEKVTDLEAIVASGVMTTPALLVDGQIKVAGRVPTVDAIEVMLA